MMCILCRRNKATVPDRSRPGRPVARLCVECHRDRLARDMLEVVKAARKEVAG